MQTVPPSRRTALLALAGSGLLAACGSDSSRYTVLDALRADLNYSLLVEAIGVAGLDATLAGPGPLTVFAPSNAAFTALLTELGTSKDALFADRTLLGAVLSYHVLSAEVLRAQVQPGRAISPVGGGFFKIEASGSSLVITDGRNRRSTITATDERTDNGVIHRIDKVLLPANRSIVQTAQALPDFSILVEAVVAAGLATTLSGTGPFTVFAPTNTAFAALLAELDLTKEQLLADRALLTQVLTYHVLPARVLRAEVPVGSAITTVQGESFTVSNGLQISDRNARTASIVATDVFTSNGVIHVVDRVILPKLPTIAELAIATPQFSILVEALTAANLVAAVSGPAVLTVFAPTNDAFGLLLAELGLSKAQLLADTALLTKVLTYHVLPGRVLRSEVPVGVPIATLQGQRFTVDAQLRITDANGRSAGITATDAFARNGTVHTLDRVILPV